MSLATHLTDALSGSYNIEMNDTGSQTEHKIEFFADGIAPYSTYANAISINEVDPQNSTIVYNTVYNRPFD